MKHTGTASIHLKGAVALAHSLRYDKKSPPSDLDTRTVLGSLARLTPPTIEVLSYSHMGKETT
jgi:hypothetical protein